MKSTVFLLSLLVPVLVSGQKIATTFQNAVDNQGISIAELDEIYQSAVHSDSSKAAFRGREKEFYNGYTSLLQELNKYLKELKFTWDKPTRCFNRIYMNKNGEIDYFLFDFRAGEIESQKEKEFERLLGEFVQTYKFPLTNKNNFAQCSPVKYSDN